MHDSGHDDAMTTIPLPMLLLPACAFAVPFDDDASQAALLLLPPTRSLIDRPPALPRLLWILGAWSAAASRAGVFHDIMTEGVAEEQCHTIHLLN
jgi:hypothetical protein